MLSLMLHAHLPFVRHPEHPEFLEEDWLFEAIGETYLPLLDVLYRLTADGVPWRLAMSVTPPLANMLRDPLLLGRFEGHLDRLTALAESEARRLAGGPFAGAARFHFLRCLQIREWWEAFERDIPGAFAELEDHGLELAACAATHGLLPLMNSPAAVRAQVENGMAEHARIFDALPAGFWLPECAFAPGLDAVLADAGVCWTALEAHAFLHATPPPPNAVWEPVVLPSGVVAFGRDRETARQVWDAASGYPGGGAYREFHRDAGWDAPLDAIAPFLPEGRRKFTGLKLHRVSDRNGAEKEPYDRAAALRAVEMDAGHFVATVAARAARLCAEMANPVVFAPFDAELFGHWWFEGPEWLEQVFRKCAGVLPVKTPGEYTADHDPRQQAAPSASSWGDGGHFAVWLDESNTWIYPELHAAEARMIALACAASAPSGIEDRALRQLARELFLAQSSDWAFLIRGNTARDYATKRTRLHLRRFHALADELAAGVVDESALLVFEERDNLLPQCDWRAFAG